MRCNALGHLGANLSRDRAAKLVDPATGAFIENVNLLREGLTTIARHPRKDWVLVGGAWWKFLHLW